VSHRSLSPLTPTHALLGRLARLTRLTPVLLVLTLSACRCGDAEPTPTPRPKGVHDVDAGPTVEGRLAALRTAAEGEAEGDKLVSLGRDAAELALQKKDVPAIVSASQVLVGEGEAAYARAMLQRSVGLLPPGVEHGKAHLVQLARLKTDAEPLQQASLWERVVKVDPTAPAEWSALAFAYLDAERLGPARAAVRRGLVAHAGDAGLTCLSDALATEAPTRASAEAACSQ
jgi:hypothetical protein